MDKDIIKSVLAGDKEAFSVIIDKYQKMIYNLCYRIFNNKSDAEDMTQETFIKAYKNLYKCEGRESIKTWMYTIAYNICIDEIRKRNTKKTVSANINAKSLEQNMEMEISLDNNSPEKIYMDKEGLVTIEKAINNLSEANRAIVFLRDIKGLSYIEISNITGLNIGTVKSRISRAHKLLQQMLEI